MSKRREIRCSDFSRLDEVWELVEKEMDDESESEE
jgi:hypothetical protein